MRCIRLLCWVMLMVMPLSAWAIGNLELRPGETSETVDWQLGHETVTVEFDLCVVASVWWIWNGWLPEPFWASIEPLGNTTGYALGDNGEIPVSFSLLKGSDEVAINQGQQSAPLAGNNSCPSASGYTLKAVMQVADQELFGNTYRGLFQLRLNWGHDGDSPTAQYEIAVNVPNVVQISDLKDLTLVEQGKYWMAENDQICVYSSSVSGNFGRYAVTADSSGVFALEGPGGPIPYRLRWQDATGNNWKDLALNEPLTKQKGSNVLNCTDGRRSGIQVEADRITIASGVYSDTVTLLVTPE